MKTLVIYDSTHGNTEKLAKAVGSAIDGEVCHINDVVRAGLQAFDLLIIGSPTHGGFPTEGIYDLSKDDAALRGLRAAAFDTRTEKTVFGYAAPKIGRSLKKSGAMLTAPPEGFFVHGIEGPLLDGELARAEAWAKALIR